MLSVRNAVVSASLLLILAIFFSVLNMTQPPDSDGMGVDSYGTRGRGFRAMFETLERLDVDVSRNVSPPAAGDLPNGTLVLLSPNPILVGTGPTYLNELKSWVESGGRIVIAAEVGRNFMMDLQLSQFEEPPPTVFDALGLSGVEISDELFDESTSSRRRESRVRPRSAQEAARDFVENLKASAPAITEVDVEVSGEFEDIEGAVQRLTIPADDALSLTSTDLPDGSLTWQCDITKKQRTLAARYKRGSGEIVVVADAAVFTNRLLATADNSVLAAYLTAPNGQPVRFDEFYHGLGVRGQPMYLLTRMNYASVALSTLLVLGLWTWRNAIFPGPPLADEEASRRDVSEYVAAMARFFTEGGKGRIQTLKDVRDGVLRQISIEVGLPPDTGDVERISTVISRTDIHRAEELRDATQLADSIVDGNKWTDKQIIEATRRMTACL